MARRPASLAEGTDLVGATRTLIEDIRLYDDLRAASTSTSAAQRRIDNVEGLLGSLQRFADKGKGKEALAEYLRMLSLETSAEQEEPGEERDLGSSRTGRWIAIGAFVVVLLVLLIGLLVYNNGSEETTPPRDTGSSEAPAPSAEPGNPGNDGDGPGFGIPTGIPGMPSELPSDIPTQLPGLPSSLPGLPSNLPDPTQIGDDAKGFWGQISDWWSGMF